MIVETFFLFLLLSIASVGGTDDIIAVHKFNSHDLRNPSPWKLMGNKTEKIYSFSESSIFLGEKSLLKEYIPHIGNWTTKYSSGPNFQSCSFGKCEWSFNNYVEVNALVNWEDIIYFKDNTLHAVRNLTQMESMPSEISSKIIGTVTSPNYPNNYSNGMDRYYNLEAGFGRTITLVFLSFDLERGPGTPYDYLKVYDGDSNSDTLLLYHSGNRIPPIVKSSYSSLYLHFHSDSSNTCKGFYAIYFTDNYANDLAKMLDWKKDVSRTALRELGKINSESYHYYYITESTRRHYTLTAGTAESHVTLSFSSFSLPSEITYVKIYDGLSDSAPLLGAYSGKNIPPTITSYGNSLYVTFFAPMFGGFDGVSASYYDDPYPEGVMMKGFSLQNDSVLIRSPVFTPVLDQICVGIIYKTNYSDGYKLKVSLEIQNNVSTDIGYINMKQANMWQYQRFIANLTLEEQLENMSIVISGNKIVSSSTVFIRSIEECDPSRLERKIVVSGINISENFGMISDTISDCVNGGVLYNNSCACPAGFIGKNCEIGCDINRFGSSCDYQCSDLDTDCKEHVLCNVGLPCSCAPGYKGSTCNISCEHGEYGAECRQKCTNCAGDGSCNPYTGTCNHGCDVGYYPPLCHDKLKHFTVAPNVSAKSPTSVSVVISVNNTSGRGTPKFIQFQYREQGEIYWKKTEFFYVFPANSTQFDSEISGLQAGKWYEFRGVILDKNLIAYEGPDIPYSSKPLCSIPPFPDFELRSDHVLTRNVSIIWNNKNVIKWCPLSSFEVFLLHRTSWLLYWKGKGNKTILTNLKPGKTYSIKLHAIALDGITDFSNILRVTTLYDKPGPVRKLSASSLKPYELKVSWQKPLDVQGGIKHYFVRYECAGLIGCKLEDCSYLSGEVVVISTHVILQGLIPHARYTVSVSAVSENEGPATTINVATDHTVPEVSPEMLQPAVTHQTNTSFTVHWKYPQNCTGINGFFYHYQYELTDESGKYLLQGSTKNTSVVFSGLTSNTEYTVKVYLVTSGGTNNGYPLLIQAFTKGRVSPKVEDLSVYKKSRNMVGLRWTSPEVSYGITESFIVKYSSEYEEEEVSVIVNPKHCGAWPSMYCYILHSLQPDTLYSIQVGARFSEVEEDADWTVVNATTLEEAPEIPENFTILGSTESSLSVSWKLPQNINGFLSSFHLTIEQTDSFNDSNCCKGFSIIVPAFSEKEDYQHEFVGLNDASTYAINVSAKTLYMGPAAVVTGNTKPPISSVSAKLTIEKYNFSSSTLIVNISAVAQYEELIKGYLLLVMPQQAFYKFPDFKIWNHKISEELLSAIADPFYIAAEFEQSELEESLEVELGTGHMPVAGKIAQIEDPPLVADARYRLILAAILEYCGVFNIAYTVTQDFSLLSLPAN